MKDELFNAYGQWNSCAELAKLPTKTVYQSILYSIYHTTPSGWPLRVAYRELKRRRNKRRYLMALALLGWPPERLDIF